MKKTVIKRTVSIFLALALMVSLIGCQSQPTASSSESSGSTGEISSASSESKDSSGETPVISVAVADSTAIEDFNTNAETLKLENELGIDLDFVTYPGADFSQKINMQMAGGGSDLQDIILVNANVNDILNWVDTGNIIPLTKYYNDESMSPNLHEAVQRLGVDFFPQITLGDGEIYSIPQFNQSWTMEYPYRPYYNMKWMEKLDAEVPTNTDELYDLLVKVKNTDLNENGTQDELGMLGNFASGGWYFPGWFHYMMNAFVYVGDVNYYTVNDGVVGAAYNTEEWKEGLKYIRKLFAEGLIPQEILTIDNDQFSTMLNTKDPSTMMFFYTSNSQVNTTNAWRNDYKAQPPLMGPNGRPQTTYRPSAATDGYFFITKNCKYPDEAFKLGDLLVSQSYSIATRYGEEGVDWDYLENVDSSKVDSDKLQQLKDNMEDGVDLMYVVYDDTAFWGSGAVTNGSWRQSGPFIRNYAEARGAALADQQLSKEGADTSSTMYQENKWGPEEVIPKLVYTKEEAEAISDIQTTLTNFVYEWTVNFLAGNMDIDASWDSYVQELETIGLGDVLEVVQNVYDRMYK